MQKSFCVFWASGIFFVLLLVLLPGCGALIDWGKKSIHQGREKKVSVQDARRRIRSVAVYDQFALAGKFDALFLSREVHELFAHMYALKWAKSSEQTAAFIARQQRDSERFISFYVLYPFDQTPLGMVDSTWSVSLSVENYSGLLCSFESEHAPFDKKSQSNQGGIVEIYTPLEIRSVELSPEHQYIFGALHSRFKEACHIRFDAVGKDDQPIITAQTKRVSLHFRSVEKETALVWEFSNGLVVDRPRAEKCERLRRSVAQKDDNNFFKDSSCPVSCKTDDLGVWKNKGEESDIEEMA